MIFLFDAEGKPLMPTNRTNKIWYMVRHKQAKILKHNPLTVQLLYKTSEYKQQCNIILTNSKKISIKGDKKMSQEKIYYTRSNRLYTRKEYKNNLVVAPNIPDNLSNVTSVSHLFECCFNLTTSPTIPTSVVNMSNTFYGCKCLKESPVIPDNVKDMSGTFMHCKNLTSAPTIPNSVTNMSETFWYCTNLKEAPIIPNKVTDLNFAFKDCNTLISAPTIPNSVTNMRGTFCRCGNLKEAPIIPDKVVDMEMTFDCCYNLISAPDIPNSVKNIKSAFAGCYKLTSAPVIGSSVTDMFFAFFDCTNLKGDMYIYSDKVENCRRCFDKRNPENELNLYIHKDTLTWNNFKEYLGAINSRKFNIHMKELKREEF